jgi:hypothetical protein
MDDDDGGCGFDFCLFFFIIPPPDDEVDFNDIIVINVNESAICTIDSNDRSNDDMYKNAARRFDKSIIILTTSNNLFKLP